MKLLLLAVAAAVVLLTGITIWVGARTREPTVVADPYEAGLAYDAQRRAADAAGHDHHAPAAAPSAGAPAAPTCDLGAGACTATVGDLALEVELGPRPLAALQELAFEARLRTGAGAGGGPGVPGEPVDGAELEVFFSMPGMAMGENRVRLTAAGGGRYRGKAVLVRCHTGRRDWVANVAVRRAGQERWALFAVQVGE